MFLLATLPALAGMATANVLIPSLVKLHFPTRIGTMTAIYSTALAIGLTAASVLTVPISDALGSWRGGLGSWAVVALIALLPWVLLIRHDVKPPSERRATDHHARGLALAARVDDGHRLRHPVARGLLRLRLAPADLPRRGLLGGDGRPAARA